MAKISIICGSYHKEKISRMLEFAEEEADRLGLEIAEVVWVPGSMEVPLQLKRLLIRESIEGAVVLGIIEKGDTDHGLVMGQAVTKGIIDLQLASMKPIGYGIIGPGVKDKQIESRLVPYARKAVLAVNEMLSN